MHKQINENNKCADQLCSYCKAHMRLFHIDEKPVFHYDAHTSYLLIFLYFQLQSVDLVGVVFLVPIFASFQFLILGTENIGHSKDTTILSK